MPIKECMRLSTNCLPSSKMSTAERVHMLIRTICTAVNLENNLWLTSSVKNKAQNFQRRTAYRGERLDLPLFVRWNHDVATADRKQKELHGAQGLNSLFPASVFHWNCPTRFVLSMHRGTQNIITQIHPDTHRNGIHLYVIMSGGKNKTQSSYSSFRGLLKLPSFMTCTLVIPNGKCYRNECQLRKLAGLPYY